MKESEKEVVTYQGPTFVCRMEKRSKCLKKNKRQSVSCHNHLQTQMQVRILLLCLRHGCLHHEGVDRSVALSGANVHEILGDHQVASDRVEVKGSELTKVLLVLARGRRTSA